MNNVGNTIEPLEERPAREVHLKDYLNIILKRKWALITFFIVVVVIVMVNTSSMEPVYRATCQVLIERESPKILNIQDVLSVDARWGYDYYKTQYEIIKSKIIAQRAIKELGLENHPDFNPKPQKNSFNPKRVLASVLSGIKDLIFHARDSSGSQGTQPQDRENQFINAYLGRLTIEPIKESRLVNISFDSHDPKLAARAANTHAKLYIEYGWERKFTTSQDAVRWLNKQLKEAKSKLEASEQQLQHYKRENDLVSIDFGEKHNIILEKLSDLNSALTAAKTTRIEKENLYNELKRISKNPNLAESIPGIVNNQFIQNLKTQYVTLLGEYSELSQKYGSQHPQMIRLRSQIEEIRGKISQEVRKIARSIETEYRVALAQERSLLAALEDQKKEALKLNQKEIQYNVIKRESESNRSMYESLLKRMKEASLTEELKVTNISIVDLASVPKSPVAPNKSRSLMMAIVVGLMGGIGLAFFFEYLDRSIKSSDDIRTELGLPFLGHVEHMNSSVPKAKNGRLITLHHPESPIAEQFRTISTNVLFSVPDRSNKVVLVTSTVPQEGKTLLAVNLAIVLARTGKRVLLVDTDTRNPHIHSFFNVKRNPGLSDFLGQGVDLAALVHRTRVNGLYVISAGTAAPNPAELFISKRMATFIEEIREKVDFVIFDAPPTLMLSDPLTLAPVVDGVLMVIRSGATPRSTIQKAIQQLVQVNARLIGAVLNDHDVKAESYYHHRYYRDYYHRYYGKDYKGARADRV